MKIRTDFLVIGSGIAGLTFALKASAYGKVAIVTKSKLDDTNTRYAQGGIAAVFSKPDNFEKHIRDTLVAGDGFCNEEVVRMVVREAPERIDDFIRLGVPFDKRKDGSYDLAREGGHSEHRILHHKDKTGEAIQKTLMKKARKDPNIEIYENHFAIEILTQHHQGKVIKRNDTGIQCFGAYVADLENQRVIEFLSKITIMATGGIGNVYLTTTNPEIATGDGIAMVYRAKGTIENMEFVQFHPTSLYDPNKRPSFLITEALRGFGAVLKNMRGEQFMNRYDSRGSLAPRDIVARAIDNEMKIWGDDHVWLDCTHLDPDALLDHFPNVHGHCQSRGIDITTDMIPVVPAQHYSCGGIKVDNDGQTNIDRLYALGEVSSTGLHGANRLASNSLIEAAVYSHRAAVHAAKRLKKLDFQEKIPEWDYKGATHLEEMVLITQSIKELQMIMSNYVGIVRSNLRLERAMVRLEILYQETESLYKRSLISQKICELRNLINVGYIIIKHAQERKESIGLHYSIDYPKKTTGTGDL
ncbi:MAG TPA: L-aspartate oxidase [Bacteroidales bacterium]|nr:L-aspartate oxidase [Bacteroidales bacterium]HPF01657.1 L-aspartate oxidase [Bacteroidales bacterium]HPJ58666.1 L-aspartate oxidase [Bacteroidales bacterium]HPR12353.1 L-aspartate oxidase [Bacteroidales bacterium]HRW84573.1 L-aspartate oxidase [Bacteroidales bacterium]